MLTFTTFGFLSYTKRNVYVKSKEFFLKLRVDEILYEERCSGKVKANYLRILLKIISTEIISI